MEKDADVKMEKSNSIDIPVKKENSSKCCIKHCRAHSFLLTFQCRFCDKHYCTYHRLPESHECNYRQSSKYNDFKYGSPIMEKVVASKMRGGSI
jgi:predicted nucleic acid binding AN1-type Zn finger protein